MALDETDIEALTKCYKNLYIAGKIQVSSIFNNDKYAVTDSETLYDYADVVLVNEFQDWIRNYKNAADQEKYINLLRSFGNSAFAYGQLKVLQENGVNFTKLSNVQLNKGMSFKVKDLLSYRCGMAPVLSPKDEILFFNPKIEYFKYNHEEEGQEYLEESNIYKSCSVSGIMCRNIPVEYVADLTLYLSKVGHICQSIFKNIEFVKDITDLDCWRKSTEKRLASEYKDMEEKEAATVITMAVSLEKARKSSTLMSYIDKQSKTLYISNQIDAAENRLIDKLSNHIDITTSTMSKNIDKIFDNTYSNLSTDELSLLVDKGYIDPVVDTYGSVLSYKISKYALDNYDLDDRLKIGKVWDSNGVALGGDLRDPIDVFRHYLPLWVEYPHNLNKELLNRFNTVFSS
jgi:hypothetical protein